MQLEIYSPAEQEHPQPIRWNYEELKAGLTEALAAYKGRVYTAENIGAAKKDRAALNKLAGGALGQAEGAEGPLPGAVPAF